MHGAIPDLKGDQQITRRDGKVRRKRKQIRGWWVGAPGLITGTSARHHDDHSHSLVHSSLPSPSRPRPLDCQPQRLVLPDLPAASSNPLPPHRFGTCAVWSLPLPPRLATYNLSNRLVPSLLSPPRISRFLLSSPGIHYPLTSDHGECMRCWGRYLRSRQREDHIGDGLTGPRRCFWARGGRVRPVHPASVLARSIPTRPSLSIIAVASRATVGPNTQRKVRQRRHELVFALFPNGPTVGTTLNQFFVRWKLPPTWRSFCAETSPG